MALSLGANTTLQSVAGSNGGGTDILCVFSPVPLNDDGVPRLFGSAAALYTQHGYSEGLEYAALHFQRTRKALLFCGMPIETPGAICDLVVTGVTGTSAVTVVAGASGVLGEHQGIMTVIRGGTIATDQIILGLSLDGGKTTKTVRLGTANSYVIPYFGATINFAAGTLVTGDVATWNGSAPAGDSDGIALCFTELGKQQKLFRTGLVIGDVATDTAATAWLTAVNGYATSNKRFNQLRVQVFDKPAGDTKAEWASDVEAEFAPVDAAPRINLGMGRGRLLSPFSGWSLRRPVQWGAALREFAHDLHVYTARKSDGPIPGVDLWDDDGTLVEWDDDDAVDGAAASTARFTSYKTWGNGPNGAFIANDLTRATDGDILGYHHNMAVANLACTIAQREAENACGVSLVLNDDGTATRAELVKIESKVNAALELELLSNRQGEGQRASKALWTAATDDVLNVANATLNGVLELNLRGTIIRINTVVAVLSGG